LSFFTPYNDISEECAAPIFRVIEFIEVEVNGWNKIQSALDKFEGILSIHSYRRGKSLDVEFHNSPIYS